MVDASDSGRQSNPDVGGTSRGSRTTFRLHERKKVALPALLRDRGGGFSWRVSVLDLSFGGAGIESTEGLDTNHDVIVEVVAPSLWDPLVLRGRVVWSSSGRIGVAFEADDAPSLFALFEVLTSNAYD